MSQVTTIQCNLIFIEPQYVVAVGALLESSAYPEIVNQRGTYEQRDNL